MISIVSISDSLANAKFEDCEKQPEVENASLVVTYDENDEFVTATYRCHKGFKLKGKSKITCDLDTDEWQELPPSCEPGKVGNYCRSSAACNAKVGFELKIHLD